MTWKPITCSESVAIKAQLDHVLVVGGSVTDCDGYWHGERFISTEWGIQTSSGFLKVLKTINRGPYEKNIHEDFRWIGDVEND